MARCTTGQAFCNKTQKDRQELNRYNVDSYSQNKQNANIKR